MISAHAYPTFELSDTILLQAKTAASERKLGPCPEIPYCPEIPSLTLKNKPWVSSYACLCGTWDTHTFTIRHNYVYKSALKQPIKVFITQGGEECILYGCYHFDLSDSV